MTTLGTTRHEQDRLTEVVTFNERVRFAIALTASDWAQTALPSSWVKRANHHKVVDWVDTAKRNRNIPLTEIKEAIAAAVANSLGFEPTEMEIEFLERYVLGPRHSADLLHQFMHGCFFQDLGHEGVSLDDLWSRWRVWRPSVRPRMAQRQFLEELKERGYPVVVTGDNGEGVVRGWRQKPIKRWGKPMGRVYDPHKNDC